MKLTARAQRLSRDPLGTVWRRRFNLGAVPPRPKSDVAAQLASSPIVAVALDIGEGAGALNDTIRVTAERGAARLRQRAEAQSPGDRPYP
ncbi:hypothetical protein SAMN05216337_104368 [Bradyrhizobium brasilense]|uniref:Uncharacterized protein n=1 Tax=Bradyrhizobium brasilense TaxID=1419277 RepID=A0A1G7I0E4_9BRAD|nr:hypothetical protein SAMN05216337_104368 [Bradyrhizobium brasilense]